MGTVICILYWPQLPTYNICGQGIVWSTLQREVAQQAQHGRIGWEQGLVFSMYNPGRFRFTIAHLDLSFSFMGQQLAQSRPLVAPWTLEAGRVGDLLVTVEFTPALRQSVT